MASVALGLASFRARAWPGSSTDRPAERTGIASRRARPELDRRDPRSRREDRACSALAHNRIARRPRTVPVLVFSIKSTRSKVLYAPTILWFNLLPTRRRMAGQGTAASLARRAAGALASVMMFPPMTVSQQDERQNVWRDAAAFFFFVLITVWLTWPLVARLDSGLSSAADALLNYWALGWDFHILPRDPLALFDANIFSPRKDTLAYSEHMFGIAVVVWPFYLVTGNLTIAYNAAILLSFVLSGLGMYLLVRDLTKSRLAAVVAGTIFLAAPYRFLHLVHVQLLTLQWFPFVFWSLSRFLRDGRPRQLGAVVLFSLLQLLSCNYYAVYLAFAIIVFGLVVLTAGRELLSKKKISLLGGGAIVVFVVALPFILPYQRNREQGFYRRYEDVVHFSASASDYANPSSFNKAPHFQWLRRRARSEKALLPGFAAMGLAAFGLYFGWKAAKGDPLRRTFWLFFVFLSLAAVVSSIVIVMCPSISPIVSSIVTCPASGEYGCQPASRCSRSSGEPPLPAGGRRDSYAVPLDSGRLWASALSASCSSSIRPILSTACRGKRHGSPRPIDGSQRSLPGAPSSSFPSTKVRTSFTSPYTCTTRRYTGNRSSTVIAVGGRMITGSSWGVFATFPPLGSFVFSWSEPRCVTSLSTTIGFRSLGGGSSKQQCTVTENGCRCASASETTWSTRS